MKVTLLPLWAIICMLMLSSCSDQQQKVQEEAVLEERIQHLHDSIMAHRREVVFLTDDLKIAAENDSTLDVRDEISSLVQADEAMMTWMMDYRIDTLSDSPNERMLYLKEQERLIVEVGQSMKHAIEFGKKPLKGKGEAEVK